MSVPTDWWKLPALMAFPEIYGHCYLTFLLVNNENAFSTACEIRGAVNGSINELALNDFGVFKNCMILT